MKKNHIKTQVGFTLVEVIVAILLLSFVALGTFAAFLNANRWLEPGINIGWHLSEGSLAELNTENRYAGQPAPNQKPGTSGSNGSNKLLPGAIDVPTMTDPNQFAYVPKGAADVPSAGKDYRRAKIQLVVPSNKVPLKKNDTTQK